ncbi:hypothetical protein MBLNU457_5078t2 [Dothideomycetes sp. NU457]
MLRRLSRQKWICPRCLESESPFKQRTSLTAVRHFISASRAPLVDHGKSDKNDDQLLREIFDSQPVWEAFTKPEYAIKRGRSVGLFRNRYLTKPEGFERFAQSSLAKCRRIVSRVLLYETTEDYRRIAKDLDRLSDLLCRVVDLCEFVRSTHPNPMMQQAATQAYIPVFEYMNVLNTTPDLDRQLKKALSMPEVVSAWTEEEVTVANILMKDFSKSAIDLPEGDRKAFVDISNDISQTGAEFIDNINAAQPVLELPSTKLNGMDPMVVRQLTTHGMVSLPTMGMPALLALRTAHDPDTRREIYMANRTASRDSVSRLQHLLQQRAKLAKLSGFDSFSEMALGDKMAKSPQAVNKFLNALAQENAPRASQELSELLQIKQGDARSGNFPDKINAWDRDYYTARALADLRYRSRTDDLSAYFSIGTVIQGLSRLFHRLYGIRLVPREILPDETWNNDVRRLDVIDDYEGHIAVIYCDLFQRAGKSPNPAHFTIRCSRRIDEEEIAEAVEHLSKEDASLFKNREHVANDGLATSYSRRDEGQLYQLPTIALICDFALQTTSAWSTPRPALLTFREVETLFHEMGHALHSVCGRTVLQNVSGTRCATDFAELPSVLMEHFASSPEVLGLYARHWETDKPLNTDRIQERIKIDRKIHGAEVESQILMSILDQRCHSADVLSQGDNFDSTKTYHDVWNTYSSVPEPAGTSWQGFFGHLVGYGATYYAYLFDRVIAAKIWREVFQSGRASIDERAGRVYREEVLRHGGGRDGWHCIAGALKDQDGVLAEGKEGAMAMVGKWGLKD